MDFAYLCLINPDTMAYTQLIYHIVMRTKDSLPVIPESNERSLYAYIDAFTSNHQGTLIRIGGMPDHIHLLVQLPPTLAVAEYVRQLKITTHHFMDDHRSQFPRFENWSSGYCALTYSSNEVGKIKQYIINQKEHHKKHSFLGELRTLLAEQGVQVDERYFPKEACQ